MLWLTPPACMRDLKEKHVTLGIAWVHSTDLGTLRNLGLDVGTFIFSENPRENRCPAEIVFHRCYKSVIVKLLTYLAHGMCSIPSCWAAFLHALTAGWKANAFLIGRSDGFEFWLSLWLHFTLGGYLYLYSFTHSFHPVDHILCFPRKARWDKRKFTIWL